MQTASARAFDGTLVRSAAVEVVRICSASGLSPIVLKCQPGFGELLQFGGLETLETVALVSNVYFR